MNNYRTITTTLLLLTLLYSGLELQAQDEEANLRKERVHHSTEVKFFGTLQSLDVKSRGKITVTEDDEDIASIAPGGYLRIRKTTFGNKKEVLIESDDEGRLSKYYYDNKTEWPFEPEGRRWLRDILLDVVRSTGIAAEDRVDRIFSEGRVDGVIDEIEELSSNSVRGKYFGLLLKKNGLSGRDLSRIANAVSDEISSSSQQGDIYRKYSHKFLASEESAERYFNGIGDISSSSEKGYTLREILKHDQLSTGMKANLLRTTEDISSSSETGSVLREFNEVFDNDPEVVSAYFGALDKVSSSSEKGSVLRDLLKLQDLDSDVLEELFESVELISSSSEQGSVLRAAVSQLNGEEKALEELFRATGLISSSSEMGSVLRSVLEEVSIDSRYMPLLFEALDRNSSSSEKGSVLRRAVYYLDNDPENVDAFMSSVERISSSSEQGSVLKALLQNSDDLSDNTLIEVLETSEQISSSSTRVEIMLEVAEWIDEGREEVKEVYKDVAKSIDSTSGYRTVMERVF